MNSGLYLFIIAYIILRKEVIFMKQAIGLLAKFISVFFIFWIASNLFKEYIQFSDMNTLIVTSLLWCLLDIIVFILLFICTCIGKFGDLGAILGFFLVIGIVLISGPVKLYLINEFNEGFMIKEIWSYVILSVVLFFPNFFILE